MTNKHLVPYPNNKTGIKFNMQESYINNLFQICHNCSKSYNLDVDISLIRSTYIPFIIKKYCLGLGY